MDKELQIPLIYIAGSSHSGSTLLDLILGSHSRIESLGEAKKIPSVLEKIAAPSRPRPLCSCLAAIDECPFWNSVLKLQESGFSERSRITLDALADFSMARRALSFSGKSFLLDSSKNHGRLRFLSRFQGFSVTCLHLTRDPRAVAFSALRKHERTLGPLDKKTRARLLFKQAFDWTSLNLKIRRRHRADSLVTYMHIRYEDFVRSPKTSLASLLQAFGLEFETSQLRFRDFVHHNIEGNRLRLQTDSEICFDGSYLAGFTKKEWALVSLLLLPALHRFGYSFAPKFPAA